MNKKVRYSKLADNRVKQKIFSKCKINNPEK